MVDLCPRNILPVAPQPVIAALLSLKINSRKHRRGKAGITPLELHIRTGKTIVEFSVKLGDVETPPNSYKVEIVRLRNRAVIDPLGTNFFERSIDNRPDVAGGDITDLSDLRKTVPPHDSPALGIALGHRRADCEIDTRYRRANELLIIPQTRLIIVRCARRLIEHRLESPSLLAYVSINSSGIEFVAVERDRVRVQQNAGHQEPETNQAHSTQYYLLDVFL